MSFSLIESCTPKSVSKRKITSPYYNYSVFSKVYRMKFSKFEDSFVVLSKYDLNKEDLLHVFNCLGLPYDKPYYGMNLAISKPLNDTTQTITSQDIIGVTLYHRVLFGLRSKETLYIKSNEKWKFVPEESEIVNYYFSCSQRYWKMRNLDSTQYKSEILLTLKIKGTNYS